MILRASKSALCGLREAVRRQMNTFAWSRTSLPTQCISACRPLPTNLNRPIRSSCFGSVHSNGIKWIDNIINTIWFKNIWFCCWLMWLRYYVYNWRCLKYCGLFFYLTSARRDIMFYLCFLHIMCGVYGNWWNLKIIIVSQSKQLNNLTDVK